MATENFTEVVRNCSTPEHGGYATLREKGKVGRKVAGGKHYTPEQENSGCHHLAAGVWERKNKTLLRYTHTRCRSPC